MTTYTQNHGSMALGRSTLVFDTNMSAKKADVRLILVNRALDILQLKAWVRRHSAGSSFSILITPRSNIQPHDLQLALRPVVRKLRFA